MTELGDAGRTPAGDVDRYMVVSADCHAGASIPAYKPYLASKWHSEFEEWAQAFHDGWSEVDTEEDLKIGVASGETERN